MAKDLRKATEQHTKNGGYLLGVIAGLLFIVIFIKKIGFISLIPFGFFLFLFVKGAIKFEKYLNKEV